VLVAATLKGICAILMGERHDSLLGELRDRFPHARLEGADAALQQQLASMSSRTRKARTTARSGSRYSRHGLSAPGMASADRGSRGSTISYAELARQIGAPKAVRAVGSACAANAIAVAIPCHRAVRSDGSLSSYRWGVERKRALLTKESHPDAELPATPLPEWGVALERWGRCSHRP
jgi:AraC family transcriptional regulator, regulatory protein of adaptative response / methylated-DNA-[protein]-cysteine methyltransferase